jgi:hypothetical protein
VRRQEALGGVPLGAPGAARPRSAPSKAVDLDHDVSLDFYEREGYISLEHYAFLIGEEEFDRAFAKSRARPFPIGPIPRIPPRRSRHA